MFTAKYFDETVKRLVAALEAMKHTCPTVEVGCCTSRHKPVEGGKLNCFLFSIYGANAFGFREENDREIKKVEWLDTGLALVFADSSTYGTYRYIVKVPEFATGVKISKKVNDIRLSDYGLKIGFSDMQPVEGKEYRLMLVKYHPRNFGILQTPVCIKEVTKYFKLADNLFYICGDSGESFIVSVDVK